MDYLGVKMLHHKCDIFVQNLKRLFDYFFTRFHSKTGELNSPDADAPRSFPTRVGTLHRTLGGV
jgi:hypothetical protein